MPDTTDPHRAPAREHAPDGDTPSVDVVKLDYPELEELQRKLTASLGDYETELSSANRSAEVLALRAKDTLDGLTAADGTPITNATELANAATAATDAYAAALQKFSDACAAAADVVAKFNAAMTEEVSA